MRSMTGFGKGEAEGQNWKVSVMLRSLNGRGLDISLRMTSYLMPLEEKLRATIKSGLRRGSVQVMLDVENKESGLPIDLDKLKENVELLKRISQGAGLGVGDDKLFELSLRYSEKSQTEVDEELSSLAVEALQKALKELIESREREGKVLKEDLTTRIKNIESYLREIISRKEEVLDKVKSKIVERAKRLELPEEHPTVINELLFLLEKMDVEEEITRLKSHIDRFKRLMESDGDVGKKLEFLAQEMHREINTLGNKIPDMSPYVVDIKGEIDRIKQQVANVE